MIIAIPVNEPSLAAEVCVSFGRAPYFLLYDTVNGASVFPVNCAVDAQGGAGIKAAQAIADAHAEAVLTVRCGENAAALLQAAQIRIYKTQFPGARENIAAFADGKLAVMTAFHAGFHGRQ